MKNNNESPRPLPTPMAMSPASAVPTPSPIPLPIRPSSSKPSTDTTLTRPHPKPTFPTPKLRLKIQDLNHRGANVFFRNSNPATALSTAVETVLSILYRPTQRHQHIPPTRSVTLIIRAMSGVAYTTGSSLDDDHKEIHFSLDYINGILCDSPTRQRDEIQGVLVHEMVHCWQWNAQGTAPGGLIEGIADFVRLKAGLDPPHWKKECGGDWDAGYQHTGYFLEWIEEKCGEGSVRRINDSLRENKYDEDRFWKGLFGKVVTELWEEYSKTFREENSKYPKEDNTEENKKSEDEHGTNASNTEAAPSPEHNERPDSEDDEPILVERESRDEMNKS